MCAFHAENEKPQKEEARKLAEERENFEKAKKAEQARLAEERKKLEAQQAELRRIAEEKRQKDDTRTKRSGWAGKENASERHRVPATSMKQKELGNETKQTLHTTTSMLRSEGN